MNRLPVILLSACCFTSLASAATAPELLDNVPPHELNWQQTGEGVAFAPLIGERFEEPYMAMVKLPAGLSARHTRKRRTCSALW